jgi:hypothetical protein
MGDRARGCRSRHGLGPPEIEARREALLKRMLSNPSDLDVAFEYANLSAQVGDYEGAISALERMLIYAPNTPRLQLELGILYYRLGAYEVARSYFEQALANPSVPPASPPRSASIFSSSRLPPIRRPSLPPSSRRSAGRATPIRDPARRT